MARIDSGGCSVSADWLHYADPPLAPIRRSRTGSITPIIGWLQYADHEVAPLRRSVTAPRFQGGKNRLSGDPPSVQAHSVDRTSWRPTWYSPRVQRRRRHRSRSPSGHHHHSDGGTSIGLCPLVTSLSLNKLFVARWRRIKQFEQPRRLSARQRDRCQFQGVQLMSGDSGCQAPSGLGLHDGLLVGHCWNDRSADCRHHFVTISFSLLCCSGIAANYT